MRVVNGSVGTQGPPPLDVNTGVGGNLVRLNTLSRWASITPSRPPADYSSMTGPRHSEPPFIEDQGLNKKIVLWHGDISTLEVDAITNSTNESMDEQNAISDRIYFRAGSALKEEIFLDVKECRTGDVKVTSGHDLHARYIIHTVGPKYNVKYQTAAETTLHMCYRNILLKARELGAQSLALCLVHTVKKNYPSDLGAHIALRTLRRFLEKYGASFHTVAICGDGHQELSLIEALLPLYFPRNEAEERASRWRLPLDIGGSAGEPHLPDRQIRIIDNPQHSAMDAEDETIDVEGVNAAFGHMQENLDKQRLLGDQRPQFDPVAEIMAREIEHQERYERLLRRAKTEDLTEVSGIGCLYQSGVDRLGRPVVIFVGKWFPFSNVNLDKALLYLIALLDPIVKGDYVIAYFHTLTSNANYPSFAWLKEVYSILPYKYKKNLKAFYIVHPTIWTKMMTWWFTTFMAPAIKQKVHNLPGVEYLYSVMAPDQLEIPAYITEYDMTVNGLHYFQPDITNT